MLAVSAVVLVLCHGGERGVVFGGRVVPDLQDIEEFLQSVALVMADLERVVFTEVLADCRYGGVNFLGGAGEEVRPDGPGGRLGNCRRHTAGLGKVQFAGPGLAAEQEVLVVGYAENPRVVLQIDLLDCSLGSNRRVADLPDRMWRTEHEVIEPSQPRRQPAVESHDALVTAADVPAWSPEHVVVARVVGTLQDDAPELPELKLPAIVALTGECQQ